jgi:hypothetical protein
LSEYLLGDGSDPIIEAMRSENAGGSSNDSEALAYIVFKQILKTSNITIVSVKPESVLVKEKGGAKIGDFEVTIEYDQIGNKTFTVSVCRCVYEDHFKVAKLLISKLHDLNTIHVSNNLEKAMACEESTFSLFSMISECEYDNIDKYNAENACREECNAENVCREECNACGNMHSVLIIFCPTREILTMVTDMIPKLVEYAGISGILANYGFNCSLLNDKNNGPLIVPLFYRKGDIY